MRETIQIVALGLTLLASTSPSLAAEEETPQPATGWQFDAMPYGWFPGAFGSVQVKGRTANINVTVGDLFTLLPMFSKPPKASTNALQRSYRAAK